MIFLVSLLRKNTQSGINVHVTAYTYEEIYFKCTAFFPDFEVVLIQQCIHPNGKFIIYKDCKIWVDNNIIHYLMPFTTAAHVIAGYSLNDVKAIVDNYEYENSY